MNPRILRVLEDHSELRLSNQADRETLHDALVEALAVEDPAADYLEQLRAGRAVPRNRLTALIALLAEKAVFED